VVSAILVASGCGLLAGCGGGGGSGSGGDEPYPELAAAGRWLAPYVGPETVVFSHLPVAASQAGASHRDLPPGGYDEALDAVVAAAGDYLILSAGEMDTLSSLFALVFDRGVARNDPRLRPVHAINDYPGRLALIFRVRRPGGPAELPNEPRLQDVLVDLGHSENHFVHGLLAMRGEDWTVAAAEFSYAVRNEPDNAMARNNQAWCLIQAGRLFETAEAQARKAVELEPGNADYLDTLIEALKAVGKEDEAVMMQARLDSLEAAGGS
jgi:tetratricopeptide (TPR) repeat protein